MVSRPQSWNLLSVLVNVSEEIFLDRESRVNPTKCDIMFSSEISLCKHSLMDHPPVGLWLLCRDQCLLVVKLGPVASALDDCQSEKLKWV